MVSSAAPADTTTAHDGLKALQQWTFYQVSVYADSYASGRSVVGALRSNLSGVHTVSGNGVHVFYGGFHHQYEPDTKIHHFVTEWRIAEGLG